MRMPGLLLVVVCAACGASTRALPDDVMPLPAAAASGALPAMASEEHPDGGRLAALADAPDQPPPVRCPAHLRRLAADHMVVGPNVLPLLRRERLAEVGPRLNPKTQQIDGLLIQSLDAGSCLFALGFRSGDVVVSINAVNVTGVDALMQAYASIKKDGSALVTVERGAATLRMLYEIQTNP